MDKHVVVYAPRCRHSRRDFRAKAAKILQASLDCRSEACGNEFFADAALDGARDESPEKL